MLNWLLGDDEDEAYDGPARRPEFSIPLTATQRWGDDSWKDVEAEPQDPLEEEEDPGVASPFPVSESLNKKLFLFRGDICQLEVDAIAHMTNENYTKTAGPSGRIMKLGGRDLREELSFLDKCRSGEAQSTKAHGLPCRMIIHTVGPKYRQKYRTAAENTLHSCYRESLKLLIESRMRTVAFTCSSASDKGYPRDEAVHIALRSLRRWLERLEGSIDAVVLVEETAEDMALLQSLTPLYFPRSLREEREAITALPEEVGNALGETEVAERKIRISKLALRQDDSEESAEALTDGAFAMADGDFDAEAVRRLACNMSDACTPSEAERAYVRYFKRAENEDFREFDSLRFVYVPGKDDQGRSIVVFSCALFPGHASADQLLLYLVRKLDPVVRQKYVIVLLYAGMNPDAIPPIELLRELYQIFELVYRNCLDQMFVLHPSVVFKALFTIAWAAVSTQLYRDTVYAHYIDELQPYLDVDQLRVPEYVVAYDRDLQAQRGKGWDLF
mmetsp:Transcript_33652/g.75216  ORF Transcript_33652/g.75216 Transcript_33652/m.75216 type:complete len:502 (+) Transcript_33652:88-1593(+)